MASVNFRKPPQKSVPLALARRQTIEAHHKKKKAHHIPTSHNTQHNTTPHTTTNATEHKKSTQTTTMNLQIELTNRNHEPRGNSRPGAARVFNENAALSLATRPTSPTDDKNSPLLAGVGGGETNEDVLCSRGGTVAPTPLVSDRDNRNLAIDEDDGSEGEGGGGGKDNGNGDTKDQDTRTPYFFFLAAQTLAIITTAFGLLFLSGARNSPRR